MGQARAGSGVGGANVVEGVPRGMGCPGFGMEDRAMDSKRWGVVAYGLPGLLIGLSLAWWGGGHGPTARAQGAAPVADTNGTIAFTATTGGTSSAQMLYLIDTKAQAFAVYRVDPSSAARHEPPLKLEAARQYKWDLRLEQFNVQEPYVSTIEGLVKSTPKP